MTTLQIEPTTLHNILSAIGIWWREIIPSAIPSVELRYEPLLQIGREVKIASIVPGSQISLRGIGGKSLAKATLFYLQKYEELKFGQIPR